MSLHQDLTHEIIAAAIEVHKQLGPGLLESVYMLCLSSEFDYRKIKYQQELAIPLSYRNRTVECAFRIDFLVENLIILELKSVEDLLTVHIAQVLTYLRLTSKPLGLLFNFNTSLLKNGIRRIILTNQGDVNFSHALSEAGGAETQRDHPSCTSASQHKKNGALA